MDIPSPASVISLSNVDRLRSEVEPGLFRKEYILVSFRGVSLLVMSSDTCRIVGSTWCTLLDDFEALKLEKNPFEGSRLCFVVSLGEDGNGGSEVNPGECGCSATEGDVTIDASASLLLAAFLPFDDGEKLAASVGDVILLLITDVRFGIAKESEAGLGMLFFLEEGCRFA